MEKIIYYEVKTDSTITTTGFNGSCFKTFESACDALNLECQKLIVDYKKRGWSLNVNYSRVDKFPSGNDYIRRICIVDKCGLPAVLTFKVLHKRLLLRSV